MKILLPIAVVVVAVVGVPLGLWKIDMFGLVFMAAGSYFILNIGLWKLLGIGMILFGLALWFDVIGISGVGL